MEEERVQKELPDCGKERSWRIPPPTGGAPALPSKVLTSDNKEEGEKGLHRCKDEIRSDYGHEDSVTDDVPMRGL